MVSAISGEGFLITTTVLPQLYLLVPAHPGCPGQSPESCKMVVSVCVAVYTGQHVNRHTQLRTGGFCQRKCYFIKCYIKENKLEFSRIVTPSLYHLGALWVNSCLLSWPDKRQHFRNVASGRQRQRNVGQIHGDVIRFNTVNAGPHHLFQTHLHIISVLLRTNLIHHFTIVTFSMQLHAFHENTLLWNCEFQHI